jgi:glycine cleavage system aminomethyltransferase T
MSLMALDEDFFFMLITAATAQWHDYEWLVKRSAGGPKSRSRRHRAFLHDPDRHRSRARDLFGHHRGRPC